MLLAGIISFKTILRKLVGLRWWSEVKEDGTEVWLYESMDVNYEPNDWNSSVFWFVQTVATLLWLVIAFIDLISLSLFWVYYIVIFSAY